MFHCPKHKILFYAIPKTGTRSVYAFLKENFGGSIYKEHGIKPPDRFKGYFTFTTVRNPYDRVCSQWWSTCKRNNDKRGNIAEFTKRGWDNSIKSWIRLRQERGIGGARVQGSQSVFLEDNRIDQILHFENLQEEFSTLPFLNDKTKLEWRNPTIPLEGNMVTANQNRPHWTELVDQEVIDLVNKVYHMDFPITGYPMIKNFDEWKKNQ